MTSTVIMKVLNQMKTVQTDKMDDVDRDRESVESDEDLQTDNMPEKNTGEPADIRSRRCDQKWWRLILKYKCSKFKVSASL